ncbi:MAG: apolipoprotein N-acyltransferase [Thermodesulfovibrionales bacterium]
MLNGRSSAAGAGGFQLYLPALLSGGALIVCFPIFDFYPVAFVALAPFIVSLYDMRPGAAFKAGLFMGLPYFFGTQYWIYHSIHHYGGMALVPSLAVVLLLAFYESLYTAFFGLFLSMKLRSTQLPALFLAPVLWVVAELVRSYLFTGFPWSSLGYSQYRFLPLIQIADITGVYGVSFLVVAVNGALADFFIAKKRRRQMPLFNLSYTLAGLALLLAAVAGTFGYGLYRLGEVRPGETFRASVVQGNIRQDIKWDPAYQREVLDTYTRLTDSAMYRKPSLVLWPETAAPFYFGADAARTGELRAFQKALGVHLLLGSVTVRGEGLLANSVILLDPSGETSYTYDKIHLVPFGEYIPLGRVLFFLDKMVAGIGDYVPGKEHLKAETPMGSFATLVCYEIIFPGLVRKFYKDGGDFMATITNDAWFGDTAGPYQHFSMAALRAVENRKPVIRAANTGVSGFIDSSGRIVSTTPIFVRAVLTEDVRTDRTLSFYSRFGDLFAYLCIIVTVLMCFNLKRR